MRPLLTLQEFIRAASERTLLFNTIPRLGIWETLDRADLVPPVGYVSREGFSSGMEAALLLEKTLELREEIGYREWTADTRPLYSFWQLLTLGEVSDGLVLAHPLNRLEHGLGGYASFMRSMADGLEQGAQFERHRPYWLWRDLILTRTQTLLLPKVTGLYSGSSFAPGLGQDPYIWTRQQQRDFDYGAAADECGVTAEDLAHFYDQLVTDGHRLDPLARWFDLADQVRRQRKEELSGTALRALDHYRAARIIRGWHSYLSDDELPDLNEQLVGDSATVRGANKRLYGEETIRANKAALPGVLEHFGLYPWRVQLIVEGNSDAAMIEMLLTKISGWTFAQAGIHTVSLGGAGIPKKLNRILGATRNYANYYLFVFDKEHNIEKVLDELKRAGHIEDEVETHIWDEDIEADNFSTEEICAEISEAAKDAGVESFHLEAESVDRAKEEGKRGVASIAIKEAEDNGFVYSKLDLARRLALRAASELADPDAEGRPVVELTEHLLRLTWADRRLKGQLRQ
jgi:hypothetical protein